MVFIALGANLPSQFGSPEQTLEAVKPALERAGIAVVCSSGIWISAPVPASDQPWYRNTVIEVRTDLSARDLLQVLHDIEHEFGRVREERNEPRVLDLDLIDYRGEIIREEGLHVPHPRMHERGFVLYPLREISPCWEHPVLNKTIDELIEMFFQFPCQFVNSIGHRPLSCIGSEASLPDFENLRVQEMGFLEQV